MTAAPLPSGFVIGIIPGRCMGNGNCVTAAEKHFDQDERDGRVFAKQPAVAQDELDTVRKALSLCPVSALELVPTTVWLGQTASGRQPADPDGRSDTYRD